MYHKQILILCLILWLPSLLRGEDKEPQWVSIVSLIANPSGYDGKHILTSGYFDLSDGYAILYLSEEMRKHAVMEDAFWITAGNEVNFRTYTGKWVVIDGIFDSKNKGRWSSCAGSIRCKIARLAPSK